jgi:arylsulfate sulfotransferase
MKHLILAIFIAALALLSAKVEAASVIITGQSAGPTPFIRQLHLTANPAGSIKSIKFQITPKAGSVTRPLSATYRRAYLIKRGYYNSQTGAILLPVFGLYANYNNTVTLTYVFTNNSSQQATVMVSTPVFNSPCGYSNPTVLKARTNSTTLSYDFLLIRNACGTFGPVIIDTDGRVRWVGTAGVADNSATLFQKLGLSRNWHGSLSYRTRWHIRRAEGLCQQRCDEFSS